ncbi:MAG: type II toxin-antitoxin system HicB family antitoxin [Planctomycetota bacterium]
MDVRRFGGNVSVDARLCLVLRRLGVLKLCIKIIHNEHGGFTALCPALPGCTATGQTPEEAREKLDEAIRGYLAAVSNFCPAEVTQELVEA